LFNYLAGQAPNVIDPIGWDSEVEVLNVVRLRNEFPIDEEFISIKERVEDWVMSGDGYDALCAAAEEERR
jgi:hypothetical protein